MKKNQNAVELGRLGGRKGGVIRSQNLSSVRKKEIAQKAAQARWAKKTEYCTKKENMMIIWKKKLTRSDAQQETQGAKMPFLRFTKANLQVDHAIFFREEFFAQANWKKNSNEAEKIQVTIDVKLPNYPDYATRTMTLDFDPNRARNHSAPTVHLLYDEQTRSELESENFFDYCVSVSSNNGHYSLIVQP